MTTLWMLSLLPPSGRRGRLGQRDPYELPEVELIDAQIVSHSSDCKALESNGKNVWRCFGFPLVGDSWTTLASTWRSPDWHSAQIARALTFAGARLARSHVRVSPSSRQLASRAADDSTFEQTQQV